MCFGGKHLLHDLTLFQFLPKNGQISGLNEKAEFPPEEFNGVCEDHVHAEGKY